MLYSHVTLLMLRVVDVVAKTTVQQSARMLVAEIPGEIQNLGISVSAVPYLDLKNLGKPLGQLLQAL
ncbi:hypothetical protein ANCCEY_02152 [Ancylostoma ceylanicum]|uniref:Uncharacterized protein n=1 Tax=Ancylostoma ceylanicum TaxID=53326 RepID=A0A0D6MCE3_9BILA|nr:hypothetical protein ANCCEY_02152 [Ancylostoma ceylanicum]